jgi:hypothetical protein
MDCLELAERHIEIDERRAKLQENILFHLKELLERGYRPESTRAELCQSLSDALIFLDTLLDK